MSGTIIANPADPFELSRFVDAQRSTYASALAQIRDGLKRTHWMWFVFPQIVGLGSSQTARHFAIRSLDEARAYIEHPVLGCRYDECVATLQSLSDTTAERVFGPIDASKLRSSLTLFDSAAHKPLYSAVLKRWFIDPDEHTLEILDRQDRW